MAIIRPVANLSRADRELLLLLGGLLVDTRTGPGRNYRGDAAPLSDAEARRLIELLEELVTSKRFVEAAFFAEEITKGNDADFRKLKEIFSYWRAQTGRNKSMSWLHWNEFLNRYSSSSEPKRSQYLPKLEGMRFSYFKRMEIILLNEYSLSPRVIHLILKFITKYENETEAARNGIASIGRSEIVAQPKALVDALRNDQMSRIGISVFPVQRIVGLATLVANSAVMFTTRDWGVAGTVSTIAGAVIASAKSK